MPPKTPGFWYSYATTEPSAAWHPASTSLVSAGQSFGNCWSTL